MSTRTEFLAKYLGENVIWHDLAGRAGPASVVDIDKQGVLTVLEHTTHLYRTLDVVADSVEVIDLSAQHIESILCDEIEYSLDGGRMCPEDGCTDNRLFGGQFCEQHASTFEWPYND